MADVRQFISEENLQDYNNELKKHYGDINVVDEKPEVSMAKEKTLYLVKRSSGDGYDAYIFNGKDVVSVINDTATDEEVSIMLSEVFDT